LFDLFISYVRDDDKEPPKWVEILQERLRLKVETAAQRPVDFFRDDQMPKDQTLSSLVDKVKDSRALLVIHSPRYCADGASWVQEEVQQFITKNGKRGIFKVEKLWVDPFNGMVALQDHVGYPFWTRVDGREMELLSEDARDYHRALSALAGDLASFLKPPEGARRVLVLHDPLVDAEDRSADRNRLKAQLESKGLIVEPPGRLSRERVSADLERAAAACQAAVILFNAWHSVSLERDWEALAGKGPRLACFPSQGLDARQTALKKKIELQQDDLTLRVRFCTLTADGIELEIEKLLADAEPKSDKPLIYLCGQADSRSFIERARRHIEQQDFRVESLADYQRLERHRRALSEADGVLIIPNPQATSFALSVGKAVAQRGRIEKAFAAEHAVDAPSIATQPPFTLLAEDDPAFDQDLDAFLKRVRASRPANGTT
jgi:hypothetical protein